MSFASPINTEKIEERLPQWSVDSAPQKRSPWLTAQWVSVNVVSTLAIVFLNKRIFSDVQLKHCQTLLAVWHFLVTFIVLHISAQRPLQLFNVAWLPVRRMLPICALFAGFLVLNNLSLATNTIGFYQLAKIMTTPTVVLISFLLFGDKISRLKLVAVLATCIGAIATSSTDIQSNLVGVLIAVSAFTVTACYQVWIGKSIKDLDVSPPQLLWNQAPWSICILLCLAPFTDTIPTFETIPTELIWMTLISGLVASMINLSQFCIIGHTSALTYNVASQVKMISILALGWYVEGRSLGLVDILGLLFAFSGVWMYTTLK